MQFTYELNGEMYIYQGPNGHGGIAYSLERIHKDLTAKYGAGNYTLVKA